LFDENNLTKNNKKITQVHKLLSRIRRIVLIVDLVASPIDKWG